jgi:hypothetical protein
MKCSLRNARFCTNVRSLRCGDSVWNLRRFCRADERCRTRKHDPLLPSAGWLYRTIGYELPSLGAEPVRLDASQCVQMPLAHAYV